MFLLKDLSMKRLLVATILLASFSLDAASKKAGKMFLDLPGRFGVKAFADACAQQRAAQAMVVGRMALIDQAGQVSMRKRGSLPEMVPSLDLRDLHQQDVPRLRQASGQVDEILNDHADLFPDAVHEAQKRNKAQFAALFKKAAEKYS